MRAGPMPFAEQGACYGTRNRSFFYEGEPASAKAICNACPVKKACLDFAMVNVYDTWGIWGGTTRNERIALSRKRQRARRLAKA